MFGVTRHRGVRQYVLFGGAAADDGVRAGDHFQLGTEKPAGHGSVRGGPDGGQLFGVVCGGVGCRRVAMVGDVGVVQRGGEFGDHHGGDLLRHYWQLGQ